MHSIRFDNWVYTYKGVKVIKYSYVYLNQNYNGQILVDSYVLFGLSLDNYMYHFHNTDTLNSFLSNNDLCLDERNYIKRIEKTNI